MKNNKISTTLAVLLFSGSMLAVGAMIVPEFVNTTAAKSIPAVQDSGNLTLTSSKALVLKVEAEAPVSTVNRDLEQLMTQEEMQQIYDFADKPNNEIITTGREMTEDEINRRLILEDQYVYDGLRPKQLFALKSGQAEFYLDLEKNTLKYPNRSLTDEELLQLIDWYYREAYALSKRNIVTPPDSGNLSQTDAVTMAASSVRKIFGADVSKLEVKASQSEMLSKKKTWMVIFSPYKTNTLRGQGKEFWQYTVIIDTSTRTVVDTTAANFSLTRTPINAVAAIAIQKDATWINEATKIVTDRQGETRKIVMASLIDTDVNNKRGMVAVKVLLEDGSSYTAELRYPDQTLRCLVYEEAEAAK